MINLPAACTCSSNNSQVGTGEYTTGFVGGGASGSDKKVGVVGLTLFDLRRRGKVGDLSMVGVSGKKFPGIRMSYHKTSSHKHLLTKVYRRPPPPQHLTGLQQPRRLIHLLPGRRPDRPGRVQDGDRRAAPWIRHHDLHPRFDALPDRAVRH